MGVEKHGRMMSELDYTKAQLAFCYITVLLSLDILNPVKIFLHVFPTIAPWHIATLAIVCMTYIFIVNMRELLYFAVNVFFHSILSIFFNDIQIVGRENIPIHGPVIFTSNHANQFMDGLMIMCTCQRKISYLVADKSWNRPIIGHLAWSMGAVPVKRAQDNAKKGTGKLSIDVSNLEASLNATIKVIGKDTCFISEIKAGDKFCLPGTAIGIKVASVEDNGCMTIKVEEGVIEILSSQPFPDYVSFEILPRIDQAEVYQNVLEKLASGGTIGIFPEGGSHDRTDLLPLKVGVALIAYSALEKDSINIPIVPVGLNYFRAHRFRGKATVEFGSPTYIDPSTLAEYQRGGAEKRNVCNDLLARIENSMRSVIVSVPDHGTLQLIHAARRLYRQDAKNETAEQRQDMGRRFAEGYKRILQSGVETPLEWISLQKRILAYQKELDELGIRDYQVVGLDHEEVEIGSETEGHTKADTVLHRMNVLGHIVHLFFLFFLAAIPSLLLNLPVGLASRIYSNHKRKIALASSKVKVMGYDVMLSERVLACIVLVPLLWLGYGLMLLFFTSLDGPSIAFCVSCFPLFSYWSIMATESGMVDIKDLKPYIMRMIPSARRRIAALPATRRALKSDLRAVIREIGPSLGEIYFNKDLNWQKINLDHRSLSREDEGKDQNDVTIKKDI